MFIMISWDLWTMALAIWLKREFCVKILSIKVVLWESKHASIKKKTTTVKSYLWTFRWWYYENFCRISQIETQFFFSFSIDALQLSNVRFGWIVFFSISCRQLSFKWLEFQSIDLKKPSKINSEKFECVFFLLEFQLHHWPSIDCLYQVESNHELIDAVNSLSRRRFG